MRSKQAPTSNLQLSEISMRRSFSHHSQNTAELLEEGAAASHIYPKHQLKQEHASTFDPPVQVFRSAYLLLAFLHKQRKLVTYKEDLPLQSVELMCCADCAQHSGDTNHNVLSLHILFIFQVPLIAELAEKYFSKIFHIHQTTSLRVPILSLVLAKLHALILDELA